MKNNSIRVGKKACSIYEPQREFLLDRSVMGEPMFREKGTTNWYRKSELLPISKAQESGTRGSSKTSKRPVHLRSLAFPAIPAALGSKSKPVYERSCLYDGVEFTTEHQAQKFHTDACRTAFWKQRKELAKVPRRLRSERVA